MEKLNSDQWSNNIKCWYEYKNHHVCEKDYVWNPATCNCENGKYLASIMDDSAFTCNKTIKSYNKKQILMKKSNLQTATFLYFTCIFINYYSIIDSCQYLLLFEKILSKTKTFITI